jgi:hypothetical protein
VLSLSGCDWTQIQAATCAGEMSTILFPNDGQIGGERTAGNESFTYIFTLNGSGRFMIEARRLGPAQVRKLGSFSSLEGTFILVFTKQPI